MGGARLPLDGAPARHDQPARGAYLAAEAAGRTVLRSLMRAALPVTSRR
jgi:hypothetical protein